MKSLSKLLVKVATWLSPQTTRDALQHIQSQSHTAQRQLEELSALLATLLSTEPDTVNDMSTKILMEKQLAEQRLKTEQAQTMHYQQKNLPHRIYGCNLTNDGVSWIAKVQLNDGNMVVGRGDYPMKALADLDEQWLGVK